MTNTPTKIASFPKAHILVSRQRKSRSTPAVVRLAKQYGPAAGLGSVITVLLGLSLTHLSHGIQIVTNCDSWEGNAMAVGLDLLIVSLEVAMVVTAGTKGYKAVARFANPALIAAFGWSAGLNAFAFAVHTASWMEPMRYVAGALGASIPALIYAGTRAWAALAISSKEH